MLRPRAGLQAILCQRLVSRHWKDASQGYCGKINITIKKPTDLSSLGRLLPNISDLSIVSASAEHLELLAAFTKLSGLEFSQENSLSEEFLPFDLPGLALFLANSLSEAGLPFDLGLLPSQLADLKLSECRVASRSQHLQLNNLTALELNQVNKIYNNHADRSKLLQHLPSLKVRLQLAK